jgi:hypothetical protein
VHLSYYIALFSSGLALLGSLVARRWLFAGVWFFNGVYTLFDKFYPGMLPQPLVDAFAFIAFGLAAIMLVQALRTRRKLTST